MNRYNLSYKYSLDYGANWIDITEIVDSANTSIVSNLCSAGFKSQQDTASFTIPAVESVLKQNLINALIDNSDVLVEICEGDTTIFTGYVDKDNISIKSYPLTASITLDLTDVSAKALDDTVDKHIYLKGKTVTQIVHYLLDLAGYAYDDSIIDTADEQTLEAFVIDKDHSETYREYIDTLLFEIGGYVLDFNAQGIARIVKINWKATGTASVVDNPMTSEGVATKTKILNEDGVSLKWASTKWSADDNQLLWQDSISRSLEDNYVTGEDVANKAYWPVDGELSPVYQEYNSDLLDTDYLTNATRKQNEDLAIIVAEDVRAEIQATKNKQAFSEWKYPLIQEFIDDYDLTKNPIAYPTKAWYLLYNESGETVNIQHFRLYGKVLYKDKLHTLKTKGTKNPKEYEADYIYTETHANQFLQFYWHFLQTSRTSVSWKEVGANRTLGDVVQVYHKGSLSYIKAVIAGITTTYIGKTKIVSYSAVGVAAQIVPYPTLSLIHSKGSTDSEIRSIANVVNVYATSRTQDGTKTDWVSTIPTLSSTAKYLWQKETIYYTDGTQTETVGLLGVYGESVTVQYSYSSSPTEAPQDEIQWASANVFWGEAQTYWSTWQDTAPAEKEGMWIWMRSKVGDGEWSYLRLTGSTGVQGVGILEIVEKYARSNDNVNAPSESEFSETIPKLESTVRYLWNYEIVRLTDGTEKPTQKRVIGVYGDTGATGYSQALITLYQRSATVPSKPTADTVYYFATGVLEGDIGLWSRAVTTGDDPLYAISASALGQGESYTIESGAWTTPAIMSESGTAGENGYTVMSLTIYQRADSAPSVPTNATFDITNKVLSGIGDWSKTYPENNGKPLWATLATISTRESSVSIPSSSWSTPQVLTQNGATGNGISSITNYYLASASDSGITRKGTAGWNPDPTTQTTTAVTKYLWNYEDILYTDGTHAYAEPRIIGTYGDNGTPAKVCKLSCDKSVVTRNDRLNTQESYKFVVDVQGYTDTAYLKIGDAARVEVAHQSTTTQLWPYKEATKLTAILYLGDVQKDSIVLEVVNETGADHYFGVQTTAPTKLSTDEMLIAGDYYLNSQDGMVYTYDGTSWVAIDDNAFDSSTNLQKVSSAMADMIKLGTTEKTTATLLAVFKYLCAESAFIQRLFAQNIEIEAGGYIQSRDYKPEASVGFKIDSDGHLDAQGAQFKGITLKEGSIISSECMTTCNKAETASIAYTNAPPTDPSMWYIYGNYVADFFIPYLGKGEQSCTITYKQKGSSNTKTRNRFNVTTKYNVTYLEIYNDGESEYADGIIVSTLDSKSSPATEQTWYVLMDGETTPALQCGAAYEKWYGITKFAKLSDITLPTEALVGNVRTGGTYSYYDTADSYDISGYTLTANASAVTVSKDGTEYTITKDNYYSVNRWPQINAEYDTKAKGVYVTAIMPKEDEADTATVGTNDLPFDKIYAHSLIGIKDGETESTATFDKVYGAVFN